MYLANNNKKAHDRITLVSVDRFQQADVKRVTSHFVQNVLRSLREKRRADYVLSGTIWLCNQTNGLKNRVACEQVILIYHLARQINWQR